MPSRLPAAGPMRVRPALAFGPAPSAAFAAAAYTLRRTRPLHRGPMPR
ncbi:hypothetical protein O1R50_22190 [Glycomyces luteolus]|uniref:Uncharacterized protein n=1 Tax=Glycomyces luteolus TaxID=2670330 RepID=A0A9X3SSB8_9ACTN|nr:hypothetical protein [Glycomyces luteolus]MDA1362351.1 hypothetical protein [Glycomyces luteolus]